MEAIQRLKKQVQDGILPALATPLHDDFSVNVDVLPDLIDFLLNKGVDGLFVAGTTGEGLLLDVAERRQLCETAVTYTNKRIPVIVHVGTFQTPSTVALAVHAAEVGADAVAVIPPPFYPLTDEALLAYYQTIASAIPNTPLILYDIPQYAVNGFNPSLLAKLGEALPSLAGIKSSRSSALEVQALLQALPERAFLLAGNERIGLGLRMLGAHGQITGLSTAIPEPFITLNHAIANGDVEMAQKQQTIINQLLALIPAGTRIGAIKQILTERGLAVGLPVPPRPVPQGLLWPSMLPLVRRALGLP